MALPKAYSVYILATETMLVLLLDDRAPLLAPDDGPRDISCGIFAVVGTPYLLSRESSVIGFTVHPAIKGTFLLSVMSPDAIFACLVCSMRRIFFCMLTGRG